MEAFVRYLKPCKDLVAGKECEEKTSMRWITTYDRNRNASGISFELSETIKDETAVKSLMTVRFVVHKDSTYM